MREQLVKALLKGSRRVNAETREREGIDFI